MKRNIVYYQLYIGFVAPNTINCRRVSDKYSTYKELKPITYPNYNYIKKYKCCVKDNFKGSFFTINAKYMLFTFSINRN